MLCQIWVSHVPRVDQASEYGVQSGQRRAVRAVYHAVYRCQHGHHGVRLLQQVRVVSPMHGKHHLHGVSPVM